MINKIIIFLKNNKLAVGLAVVVLAVGGYFAFNYFSVQKTVTKYVLGTVEKGTVAVTVTGTGQVSASNQLEVKPKVSGDIISVNVVAGQEVKEGDVLAKLDPSDALKSVRSAQASLESAKLSLEKSQRGYRPEELLNDQLNLETLQKDLDKAKENAEDNLADAYVDANSVIQDSYNKADEILNKQIEAMFDYGSSNNPKINFLTSNSQAEAKANNGRAASNQALAELKSLAGNPAVDYGKIDQNLDSVLRQLEVMQDFLNDLTDAVNSGIASVELSQSALSSYKTSVSSARTSINSAITTVKNQKQTITNQKNSNENSIEAAEKSLAQAQNSYNLKTIGADPLDLKGLEITVRQRTNDLLEAQKTLADYTIKAPFSGVVASVGVKAKESASGSTVIATLITKQKMAEISLNEVDVAKVSVGQKASLTFDAVEDLAISGQVVSVDSIGTASQGVVSYNAKIGFDTEDERIKPGMSASASIITDIKQEVLTIANNAVKTQGGQSYVEKFEQAIEISSGSSAQGVEVSGQEPTTQEIEIGLSNDSLTEIISGLKEGDQVIIKKIVSGGSSGETNKSAAQKSGTSQTPNIMQSLGGSGGPGGMPR